MLIVFQVTVLLEPLMGKDAHSQRYQGGAARHANIDDRGTLSGSGVFATILRVVCYNGLFSLVPLDEYTCTPLLPNYIDQADTNISGWHKAHGYLLYILRCWSYLEPGNCFRNFRSTRTTIP